MTGANSHINTITNLKEGNGADVGAHQEASVLPQSWSGTGANVSPINYTESAKKSADTLKPFSKVGTNGWSTTNTYGGTAGAQTVRPTNTSVNVAIKCESTPRVVVSTGTYQVSVAATQAAGTGTLSLDSTDIEGDSTMVDGDELVAPVDGLYNFGTQMSTHGNTPYYYRLSINGESISWNTGIGVSTLLRLRTGDRVKVVYDSMNAVNTGRVNMALSQVVDDKKVAEAMLKPNLWTPGVEQSFGDGVYGMRFVITNTTTNPAIIDASKLNIGSFIARGGSAVTDMATSDLPIPNYYTPHAFIDVYYNRPSQQLRLTRGSQYLKASDKFDYWFTYTKKN